MAYSVKNHILYKDGKPVAQRPTRKISKGRTLKAPIGLTVHYTAGLTAESAIATLTTSPVEASAHLVMDRSGVITQLALLNAVTWHAGTSSWRGRSQCNGFMIGIEVVNAGPLIQKPNGKFYFEVAKNRECPEDDVVEGWHKLWPNTKYWQEYTPAQISELIEVGRALREAYNIKEENFVGHEQIAPTRKSDPGPAFPYVRVKAGIFGGADNDALVVLHTKTGLVEKPREEITVADLREAGSRTITGADQAQSGIVGAIGSIGGATAALSQVQDVVGQANEAVVAVRSGVGALEALKTYWPLIAVVALSLVAVYFAWRVWRGASLVKHARVDDACCGVNVGR